MVAPAYYEDFQRTIDRRAGLFGRGLNVQAFYRELREHAGTSGNVGPTVVDIAFLLYLLERVREVKMKKGD